MTAAEGPSSLFDLGLARVHSLSTSFTPGGNRGTVSAHVSSKTLEIIRLLAQDLPPCRMMGTFCGASLTRPLSALMILVTRRDVGSPRKKMPGHLSWWFCSSRGLVSWLAFAGDTSTWPAWCPFRMSHGYWVGCLRISETENQPTQQPRGQWPALCLTEGLLS